MHYISSYAKKKKRFLSDNFQGANFELVFPHLKNIKVTCFHSQILIVVFCRPVDKAYRNSN